MDEVWKKRNRPNAAQLTGALGESVKAVSYTHLDVYKRQYLM